MGSNWKSDSTGMRVIESSLLSSSKGEAGAVEGGERSGDSLALRIRHVSHSDMFTFTSGNFRNSGSPST